MPAKKTWEECLEPINIKHGSKIVSITCDDYVNLQSKPIIECSNGHIINNQTISKLISGRFCSKCSGNYRYTYEEYENIIREKHKDKIVKISCSNFKNNRSKVKIKCNNDHEFESSITDLINQGSFCRLCSDMKTSERQLIPWEQYRDRILLKHPNKIRSISCPDFFGNKSKPLIECNEGHVFNTATINNLLKGTFCDQCGINKRTVTLTNDFEFYKNKILEKYKNKIISITCNDYVNIKSKPIILCNNGHEFKTTSIDSLLQGNFCNKCGTMSSSEKNKISWDIYLERIQTIHGHKIISIKCDDFENVHSCPEIVCSNGHTFNTASINSLTNTGTFCPICSISGYDPTIRGYLYINLIQNTEYFKVGITNKPKQRIQKQNYTNQYLCEFYKIYASDDGKIIRDIECEIKKIIPMKGLSKDVFPDGYTETFHKDELDSVLNIIRKYDIEEVDINDITK